MPSRWWLAMLARAGFLRASFVPPDKLRELRLIACERQNLIRQLAQEKNRLHKIFTNSGVRLGVVVSDLNGKSARAMIKSLIAGELVDEVMRHVSKRLQASPEEILEALQGDLSGRHCFVLREIMAHIELLEATITRIEDQLLQGLEVEHRMILNSSVTRPARRVLAVFGVCNGLQLVAWRR